MSGVQSEAFSDPVGDDPEPDLAARVAELEAEVANLEVALQTRTRIGTAIGLLAERHQTTTDLAWSLLTRLSNHTNNKVQEVARLLVAVADGTLESEDVAAVGELARSLPRAVAAIGLGGEPTVRRRRRSSAPRTRVVAGPVPEGRVGPLPSPAPPPYDLVAGPDGVA